MKNIDTVAQMILESKCSFAFTGAGISLESGIPTFRGKAGLWNRYNPNILDIDYFYNNPKDAWEGIKEIFYDYWNKAMPNKAHYLLADMEKNNLLNGIITQNIDNLHQKAGNKEVYEFHGTLNTLHCVECMKKYDAKDVSEKLPFRCDECGGLVKPDFVFFGEGIPELAYQKSIEAASKADLFIVIGTTGEVMPACSIPVLAKRNGAKIIEINPEKSTFTDTITDVYIKGKAAEVAEKLYELNLLKEIW